MWCHLLVRERLLLGQEREQELASMVLRAWRPWWVFQISFGVLRLWAL